jgi:hypothetical protein
MSSTESKNDNRVLIRVLMQHSTELVEDVTVLIGGDHRVTNGRASGISATSYG